MITGIGAGAPTVLGGCSIAFDLYMDRVAAAYGRPQHGPLSHTTLEDRIVRVAGPFAIALGPDVRQVSVLSTADRQYLLDRSTTLLRRCFPKLVAVDSTQAAIDRRFWTILELDIVSESDEDDNLRLRIVLRVRDHSGTITSVIQGQLYGIDAGRANQRKMIDAALPLIDAKTDMLVRRGGVDRTGPFNK